MPQALAQVIVSESGQSLFSQDIRIGQHQLTADEPKSFGGGDIGPSPYDLLLASLGACTSMTLRMYAERKQWPLEKVIVTLSHSKIHAEDCVTCTSKTGKIDRIERHIELRGELSTPQRTKLLEIADKCPVHRTLQAEISIQTLLLDGD